MAQGLEVAHTLHRAGDRLPIDDAPRPEGRFHPEPLPDEPGEHLQLDLPHKLEVYLPQCFVPNHPELGVLLLQLAQVPERGVDVAGGWEDDLVVQHRLQLGRAGGGLRPKDVPRPGLCQAGEGAHRPRRGFVQGLVLGPGVDPDLVDLLPPQQGADLDRSAGNLHVGEPVSPVPGDLEDPGGKLRPVFRNGAIAGQPLQQLLHPLQLQRRAEIAGEGQPPGGEGGGVLLRDPAPLQVLVHQALLQGSQLLLEGVQAGGEIQTAAVQLLLELGQKGGPAAARQVHLVYKEEGGDFPPGQQLPQGAGVALDAVGAADHQHGAVQHRQRPLHLGGEVHVPRGVQQGEGGVRPDKLRLFGKDGDAPLPLLDVGV